MRLLLSLLIGTLPVCPTLSKEKPPVAISKAGIDYPTTPVHQNFEGEDTIQVRGMRIDASENKKWLRISATYSSAPPWIDRMTLEFYILTQTPDKKPILFKGSVPYLHIPKGQNHRAEMYLHFNTCERYFKRGVIDHAVVAIIDGKMVTVKSSRHDKPEWFKGLKPHPCGLLNREQTPFRAVNTEKYQAIDLCNQKQKTSQSQSVTNKRPHENSILFRNDPR